MKGEQKHGVLEKKIPTKWWIKNESKYVFLLCLKKGNKSHVSNEHQLLFQR